MDKRQAKRDLIFGTIGLVWGALIVLNTIIDDPDWSPQGGYQTGNLFAFLFGVAFAVAGFVYRRRGRRTLDAISSTSKDDGSGRSAG